MSPSLTETGHTILQLDVGLKGVNKNSFDVTDGLYRRAYKKVSEIISKPDIYLRCRMTSRDISKAYFGNKKLINQRVCIPMYIFYEFLQY